MLGGLAIIGWVGRPAWSGYCALDGDFLWVAESDDENDIFTIKKYRLGI